MNMQRRYDNHHLATLGKEAKPKLSSGTTQAGSKFAT
jgi:hypothetical protein